MYVEQSSHVCYYTGIVREHLCEALCAQYIHCVQRIFVSAKLRSAMLMQYKDLCNSSARGRLQHALIAYDLRTCQVLAIGQTSIIISKRDVVMESCKDTS
jgi:hypothetical protein